MTRYLCVSLVLSAVTAWGQVVIPRVDATVDVRVIELEVVVTRRDGSPVRGLTAGDFVVRENGRAREITNLSEFSTQSDSSVIAETRDSSSASPKSRNIVIFFDTLTTDTFSRQRAVRALTPFLTALPETDEVMVVSWNRKLEVVVAPTNDQARILEGLKTVPLAIARGLEESSQGGELISGSFDRSSQFRGANDAEQTTRVLRSIVHRMSGASGRKLLFVVSNGLNFETDLNRQVTEADLPQENPSRLSDSFRYYRRDIKRPVIDEIVDEANAAGVTFYTMQPSGLTTGASASDIFEGDDSIGSIDTRGLFNSGNVELRLERARQGLGGLVQLADRTGGRFIANTNDLTRGVGRIDQELSNYYSLAYKAEDDRPGSAKKLEVRAKNRDYVVRARKTILEQSPDTQVAQQIVSNFLFPVNENTLKIAATAGLTKRRSKVRFSVPVDIVIPYATMAFISEGSHYVAQLSLFVASGDDKNNVSEVRRYDRTVKIPRAQLATLAKKSYMYPIEVDLQSRTAKNQLTIAVVDQLSKLNGFALVDVPLPVTAASNR